MPWGRALGQRVRKPPFGFSGLSSDDISRTFPYPGILPIRIRNQILAPAADDTYKTDVFSVLWGFSFSFLGVTALVDFFRLGSGRITIFFGKKDWGIHTVPGTSGSATTPWPGSFCVYCPVLEPLQTAYEVLRDGRHASGCWPDFLAPAAALFGA